MTRKDKARDIKIICEKCGCNEEQKRRHFQLFVNEEWQPHTSLRFRNWWFSQPEFKESKDQGGIGTSPVVAQNVARIWDSYLEAKQIGVA